MNMNPEGGRSFNIIWVWSLIYRDHPGKNLFLLPFRRNAEQRIFLNDKDYTDFLKSDVLG